MVEVKPLKQIMTEYRVLLEKYEDKIGSFEIDDIKRLIGEVRLFWYRHQKYIKYFLANLEKDDEVAYLAGAVRLDIVNDGHLEFVLVGKCRIINDPLLKLATFYNGTEQEINFQYANQYLRECVSDLLLLLRDYCGDFYVLPIEPVNVSDVDEYYSALSCAAEKMILALFAKEYSAGEGFVNDNHSYEEIEAKMLPGMNERLIFNSLDDVQLSLREKCTRYLDANGSIMPVMNSLSEPQKFYMLVNQYCMQALAIVNLILNCKMIAFIRNDVTFQYFTLVFNSSVMEDLSNRDYLQVYIPYVIQKAFDFSDRGYQEIKDKIGCGKIVEYIINSIGEKDEEGKLPLPKEIVQYAYEYLKKI